MDSPNRFTARDFHRAQVPIIGPPQLPVGLLEFNPRIRVTLATRHPVLSIPRIICGNFLPWILYPYRIQWFPSWAEGEVKPHIRLAQSMSLHRLTEVPSLIRRRLAKTASLVILFLLHCRRRPINRLRTLQLLSEGRIPGALWV